MEATTIFWATISIFQGVVLAILLYIYSKNNKATKVSGKRCVAIMAILLLVPNPLYAFLFKQNYLGNTTKYPIVPTLPLYYARVETAFGKIRGFSGYFIIPFKFGDAEPIGVSISPLDKK